MKNDKTNSISKGAKIIFAVLLIIVSVIAFIAFYLGVTFIQEKLFTNGQYLTYMIKSPYSKLVFIILILAMTYIAELYSKNFKLTKYILPAIVLLTYITITSVTVVTKDGIVDYSFYNLKGDKYKFSEIVYVNTGFVDSGKYKGEFFYNIELENGKKIKLSYPSLTQPGEQYDDDTWQEYVDIDNIVMKFGAKKDSSENGVQYVSMDKIYIDKLLKVVKNTN